MFHKVIYNYESAYFERESYFNVIERRLVTPNIKLGDSFGYVGSKIESELDVEFAY